ncbi:hypothetical protein C7974DRAFT_355372 [Boeremia exigua]|uniref:uncharacterized protein n=1 Tax=Boeremia exigua TaxID=749465 RepID=UPI001E8E8808|nr:uncharacterized protein C7974DRAFT_355372 [Boeremia exigua]KAH6637649.1 hypothetical protein C7974DRAFT_355372 [Boeremia exigua]
MATFHDDRRPTTPTGPSRTPRASGAMRALNTNPPRHETFFDDATPVDHARDSRAESEPDRLRDSHDLSFAEGATARDSVVDNMLLSLDQFSTATMFAAAPAGRRDDEPFFIRDSSYRPPGNRNRGHTYTASGSTDYDPYAEETTPRYPSHMRARRSNSSNNIASPSNRSASTRDPYPRRQANPAYGQYQQTAHMRGGGTQGSKSSGSSSMDFGQTGMLGTHRLGFGKRSASFDHSNRSGLPAAINDSLLDRGRAAYMNYDHDYDAAPEPTVPAGPRKRQPPQQQPVAQAPQQPAYAPPMAPVPRRRGSMNSNMSYRTLKKGKSQLEPSMRAQAQEFVNASTLRELPSVPAFQEAMASAPQLGTRRSLFGTQDQAPKEKPGFFRRVFGGGSSKAQAQPAPSLHASNAAPPELATSALPRPTELDSIYSNNRPRTTPSTNAHIANQLKSLPKVPQSAGGRPNDTQPPAPPVLTKKPSSFFRRRKKSISEPMKPPIMSLEFAHPPKPFLAAQPSPSVSSLRQVMNPYLVEPPLAPETFYDTREHQQIDEEQNGERPQGFSPGYKPHKDATVRSVRPSSPSCSPSPSTRSERTKSQDASNIKSKPNAKHEKAMPTMVTPQEDTFLADSSSCNEDRSGRATPVHEPSSAVGPTSPSLSKPITEGPSEAKARREPQPGLLTPTPNARVTSGSTSASQPTLATDDEGWVVTAPVQDEKNARGRSPSARRVWLDTTVTEEPPIDGADSLQLPSEGARASPQLQEQSVPVTPDVTSPSSPNEVFHSATSLPIVQIETRDSDATMPSIAEDRSTHPEPTDADRERALRIFSGNETVVQKSQAAAALGDVTLSSARIRRAFMDLFEWTGFTILAAMRDMCGKIVLKAETQQVDRILMSLSERWCECNVNHGFKEVDVVHTICYSILLLNTDLHVADIETRMTRSQFVRNTLPTVTRVCQDAIKADQTLRPKSTHFRRGSLPWNDNSEPVTPTAEQPAFPTEVTEENTEGRRARSRLSVRPAIRSGAEGLLSFDSATSEANTLVNTPYNGPMKGWEFQIEMVLKEFYESIRKHRLPLHGASDLHHQPSSNNLSVAGVLRRTPSVLSKAPSDNTSYRGRTQADFRSVGARWASKNRSKQRMYPASTVASSRTSLDDNSVWSPAGSSSWSRYSYGKTGTSMSVDSMGSHFAAGDYQQAIGFANALSQAIIREEGMTIASDEDFARAAPLLEDESLELVGAPWAKEGILKHKHHLETVDRKAKDRNWSENFAVIEKGYMRLFSFSMNSKSARMKSKAKPAAGGIVGGGNWMDNAEALEVFPLRQTIASALPPPGYSKTRPHVWALSLPTGAVHLFQVGTPDIVREFVTTANYWSARLSKEPLTGGVTSMEYGWGENVINPALIRQDSIPTIQGHMPRPSVASSLRSSMDHATGVPRARLPGDKAILSDWSPPTASMMASNLMEVDQLRALSDYVKNIEAELALHNELRAPLLITFSPRHPNAAKAMANWERKSQYLLKEIVKFRTYIDTLALAQSQKEKIYAEREASGDSRPATKDGAAEYLPSDEVDGAKEVPRASEPIDS